MDERCTRLNELAGEQLKFASPEWNAALLGFVENWAGTKLPCYGYQALKASIATKYKPADMYRVLNTFTNEGHFILHRLSSKALWSYVLDTRLPRWESLDRAALGLGYRNYNVLGLVYNRTLCISEIAAIQAVSDENPMANYAQAVEFITDNIIPNSLGTRTPWYLTPVN